MNAGATGGVISPLAPSGVDSTAPAAGAVGSESTRARSWEVSSLAAFRRVVGSFEVRGL